MKSKLIIIFSLFSLVAYSCTKGDSTTMYEKAVLKIEVDYEKQEGRGSNQWAVWIEDSMGEIVKTLYVTSFTADGGYKPRPACTSIWVSKAKPEEQSGEWIDGISGATPSTGLQTYVWDLTNEEGSPVNNGDYVFVVEANLYGDSEVIFKSPLSINNKAFEVVAMPEFTKEDDKNKGMIKSVRAVFELID